MPGPQSENPRFEPVYEPPSYAGSTDGPIRYTTVYVDDRPVTAYAQGVPPLELLRHWAAKPVDPAEQRCGVVRPDEEREAASLAPLQALADW